MCSAVLFSFHIIQCSYASLHSRPSWNFVLLYPISVQIDHPTRNSFIDFIVSSSLSMAETSCSSSVISAVTNFKWHLVREQLEFIIRAMVHRVMEFVLLALALVSKVTGLNPTFWRPTFPDGGAYCLSWRLAVEANNLRAWRTVPPQCLFYVEKYMTEGQYEKDLNLVIDQIRTYVNQIVPSGDSLDAWILDIDDTCISNVGYYKEKKYGCDPYDPVGFRTWALKGACPAIRSVLGLFRDLIGRGFKVILLTGRDEQTLGQATLDNLQTQGFVGYEQLIMRTEAYKGRSAVLFKSEIRKKLVAEGYRIWGNVGDQWSDLQGEVSGNRTFKLPNPMYYVP